MKLKNSWYFTKWNGWNIAFVIQYISLQIGNKVSKTLSSEYSIQMILFETQKYIYVPNIELLLLFFFNIWSYSQPCFDIAQLCRSRCWKWQRCFDNAVLFKSTSKWTTLIWRCSVLKITTLTYTAFFQRWFNAVLRRDFILI